MGKSLSEDLEPEGWAAEFKRYIHLVYIYIPGIKHQSVLAEDDMREIPTYSSWLGV
jgi:hypothetical protein